MAFYRGGEGPSQKEEVDKIIEKEATEASSTPNSSFSNRLVVLKSAAFLRPFKCVGVIIILCSMSGISTLPIYTASFFEAR